MISVVAWPWSLRAGSYLVPFSLELISRTRFQTSRLTSENVFVSAGPEPALARLEPGSATGINKTAPITGQRTLARFNIARASEKRAIAHSANSWIAYAQLVLSNESNSSIQKRLELRQGEIDSLLLL